MDGNLFQRFTTHLARFIGRPLMLMTCTALAVLGVASYASGNEMFINGTNLAINVLTLMLLPILQATQNHDGAALQAKLDELIKASAEARNDLIGIENREEDALEQLRTVPDR
jgi:low affinity Fe/Cu permease